MQMDLPFEELAESDTSLFEWWLRQAHVRVWWDDGEISPEQVRTDHGPEESITRYVMNVRLAENHAHRPAGVFQHYDLAGEEVRVDLFIGEAHLLGTGIGTEAVRAFSALILRRIQPASILLDPHPENKAAVWCYEKAGFRREAVGVSAEGVPALLMQLRAGVR